MIFYIPELDQIVIIVLSQFIYDETIRATTKNYGWSMNNNLSLDEISNYAMYFIGDL